MQMNSCLTFGPECRLSGSDYRLSKSQNFSVGKWTSGTETADPLIACRLGKAENRVSVFVRPKATLMAAQVASERNFFVGYSLFFLSFFFLVFLDGKNWRALAERKEVFKRMRTLPFCIDDAAGFPRIRNR